MNGISDYPLATAAQFQYDSTLEKIKELMPKGVTAIDGVDIHRHTHVILL
ncbi:hypothetical protein [Rossellomorea aquimaris]|nr:hypothetical protein [Rossellomorea aquimaris]